MLDATDLRILEILQQDARTSNAEIARQIELAPSAVFQRIRKLEDGSLEILFTIDDPAAFTQPWTARRVWQWRPDVRFFEYVCEENNRNAPDANGVLRNF